MRSGLVDEACNLLRDRAAIGLSRYGTYLQSHNGRFWRKDALEEAADLVFYLRQGLAERSYPHPQAIAPLVLKDVTDFAVLGQVVLPDGNPRNVVIYESAIALYLELVRSQTSV